MSNTEDARGLFYMYRRGWVEGASGLPPRDVSLAQPNVAKEYALGYTDGRAARTSAIETAASRLLYDLQLAMIDR